jgi:tRNA(Ile)-lysidine synthase TilS/MesJ
MADPIRYSTWKNDHLPILQGLAGKKIVLTFSGGKDSSAGLYLLHRASSEFDFSLEAHAVLFPHHVFPEPELQKLEGYWERQGVRIHWHDAVTSDKDLEAGNDIDPNPCLVCNRAKKRILLLKGQIIFREPHSVVLMMSYSLWDLVSATLEHILGGYYAEKPGAIDKNGEKPGNRFLETSQRFYPLIRLKNGLQIFKPLIRYNDQQILGLIEHTGIPLSAIPCRYRDYRPKRQFSRYYEKVQLQFDFDQVFAFAKEVLKIPDLSYYEALDMETYFDKLV